MQKGFGIKRENSLLKKKKMRVLFSLLKFVSKIESTVNVTYFLFVFTSLISKVKK